MFNNKKYFPSIGFVLLVITSIATVLLIQWTVNPHKVERKKKEKIVVNKNKLHKEPISFISGGHLYGSPHWHGTQYPAPSLLENIDRINNMKPNFFIGLGDIVNGPTKLRFDILNRCFIKKLKMPFYNVVGNHDISKYYLKNFNLEKYYFSFLSNNNLFIILDTESTSGEIKGEQLLFYKNQVKHGEKDKNIKNIFIFSHKLLWAYGLKEKYEVIYDHINSKSGYKENNNFKKDLFQILLNSKKHIYWFSGDIGANKTSLPFVLDVYNKNITFIAIGLGDTKDDMLLKTVIDTKGKVDFKLISLINFNKNIDIKKYTVDYWKSYFNWKKKDSDIKYFNRYSDGWSQGKSASIKITQDVPNMYNIKYFTSSPEKRDFKVIFKLDEKVIKEEHIENRKINNFNFYIDKGIHTLKIEINHTFNPSKLNMSSDNRDLGVHFDIKKRH